MYQTNDGLEMLRVEVLSPAAWSLIFLEALCSVRKVLEQTVSRRVSRLYRFERNASKVCASHCVHSQ